MRNLINWKGLKFPDIYIIRFFFKFVQNTQLEHKSVVEFGCGTGNNLYLFNIYGFKTQGVDISEENIKNAIYNFSEVLKAPADSYKFLAGNMTQSEVLKELEKPNDVLLLPNVVYYITREEFLTFLKEVKNILSPKGVFFVRFRSPRDGRSLCLSLQNGKPILKSDRTGEKDTVQTFYEEYEMVDLLREYLNIHNFKVFHSYAEVEIKGGKIFNSDIIIWGNFKIE